MNDTFDESTPDLLLARAVRVHRSEAAFGALYRRHTPRAFQTAWRILGGDRHEAEDAVQEARLRAVASLERWRGETSFGAWFRSVTAHVAIDMVRRTCRIADEPEVEWSGGSDDEPTDRLDLETAIMGLAPGYRAVLVLHDIEGFTHEEIGERLGITAGTSKAQLFKARRAVRASLSPSAGKREKESA
jgi:RNA polymerase sigma-70 factor (ECF subfamily)